MSEDIQIYELPPKPSVAGTDQLGTDDATNVTYKITIDQILAYINGKVNLQKVYDNSGSSPAIKITPDGFFIKDPVSNTLLGISTSDSINYSVDLSAQNAITLSNLTNSGSAQFDGLSLLNYIPSDQGVNNPNFTFTARSSTPSNSTVTSGYWQFGFSDESSSPSGFFKLDLTDQGLNNNILYATGAAGGNPPRVGINGQLVLGIPYGSSSTKYAQLQLNSTIQGFLPNSLTSTQEDSLVAMLGADEAGLSWYNNIYGVQSFWDGADKQQLLSLNNIVQGANMIITPNADGSVVFASSGGGTPGTQVQGSFTSSSPSTTTVVGTISDAPIAVSPGGFTAVNPVGTNVTTQIVSGVTTAIIENTATGGRWCQVDFDLTMYIPAGSNQEYRFTVYTSSGFTQFFKRFIFQGSTPIYKDISICAPMVYLNTNDYVYLAVSGSGSSLNFNAYYFNGRLIDTTIASLPGTGALPQTGNNFYLSQDGGSTLASATGTIVNGNLAQFSGTSGLIEDVGIAPSDLVLLSGNQTISGTKTFSSIIMGDLGGVASNANNINTAMQYADLDYYVGFYPSQTNGYQQTKVASTLQANPLRYNPVTGALTTVSFVGSLTGNADTVTDGVYTSGSYADPAWITALSASKLTGAFSGYSGGNSALTGTNSALIFGSSLSNGNYLQFPGGNNVGQFNFGGFPNLFSTYNLTYDATAATYKYVNTGQNAFALEFTPTGIYWKYAGSGTAGDPVALSTAVHLNSAGIVNIQSLAVLSMVVTDSGKNLVSAPLPLGINAIVTSNSSTQAMSWQTCYIVTYSGGQMVGSLPAATGSGKVIRIIGLSGASTAGWKAVANGTDIIQFNSSISAAGGNIASTPGSATDCVDLLDAAAGVLVVYSAAGLDLVIE